MIGKRCKHIESGHIGKIKRELKGNDKFPDQWGIYWDSGKQIKEKGLCHYWQDQNKIICL